MSKKFILKGHLKGYPRERRLELEAYIDAELSDQNVEDALEYIKKLESAGTPHYITRIVKSNGNLSVTTETGVTIGK